MLLEESICKHLALNYHVFCKYVIIKKTLQCSILVALNKIKAILRPGFHALFVYNLNTSDKEGPLGLANCGVFQHNDGIMTSWIGIF